jgi:signal transduction histidine kinase
VANRLLEIYAPVRERGTGKIIAVVEFYQRVEELEAAIQRSQRASWLAVFTTGIVMYTLLVGYVAQLSRTVAQQRVALSDQVVRLTNLLRLNRDLDGRVRRAAVRTTELNERYQRRLSSELHDGPAQYLGLALLRIDRLGDLCDTAPNPEQAHKDLEVIRNALTQTMQEVRSICSGLGLPNLERLTTQACVERAIRAHERSTGSTVTLSISQVPDDTPLSVKITLYRVIQEALTNAYRHAKGVGQEIVLRGGNNRIQVEVADRGPGITIPSTTDWSEHMGLSGMRERVESNGGIFRIESRSGYGTRIFADLPLAQAEEHYD